MVVGQSRHLSISAIVINQLVNQTNFCSKLEATRWQRLVRVFAVCQTVQSLACLVGMSWRAEPSDSQMGVSCTGVVTPLIVDIRRLQFSVDDGVHCHTCDALQTSELISGTYDEAESAASFQEALQAWRQSDTADTVKQSACVYRI